MRRSTTLMAATTFAVSSLVASTPAIAEPAGTSSNSFQYLMTQPEDSSLPVLGSLPHHHLAVEVQPEG